MFTISGGIGVSCNEFFGHYSRMLGKPPPRRVPTAVAMALAAIPETAAWISGGTTELRRSSVIYMTRTGTYSIEKARRMLGYEPAVGLDEGMRRSRGVAARGGADPGLAAAGVRARLRHQGGEALGEGGDRQARIDAEVGGNRARVGDVEAGMPEDLVAGIDDAARPDRRRSPRRRGCGR